MPGRWGDGRQPRRGPGALDRRLALIAGTSTCHMAMSAEPRPVHGVWGPYFGAVLPGLWLNEGGQSATGALLDHIPACTALAAGPAASRTQPILARIAGPARGGGRELRARGCTCCRTSTATARRWPTRMRSA